MAKLTLAKAYVLCGHVYVNKNLYVSVMFITKSVVLVDSLQRGLNCGCITRSANQYVYTYTFSKRKDIGRFAAMMLAEKELLSEEALGLMNLLVRYSSAQDRGDRLILAAEIRKTVQLGQI